MDDEPATQDVSKNALLRALPKIDALLAEPSLQPLLGAHPRARALAALRTAVSALRTRWLAGDTRPLEPAEVQAALTALTTPLLRPVFNATGVVLHTNLGRAPLAPKAIERVRQIAEGYSNLEFDLEEGDRGSRYDPVVPLLCELTGAEAAVVVNNNAAAVLLVLSTLAAGKEAIVSRGELVEIGGGFRVPEVMAQSGARLIEVGTTNRTRLSDYEGALRPETGLLCKIHRSNFALVGFTEEVPTRDLVGLGRARGVPVYEDLGSGSLVPAAAEGLVPEPTVASAVSSGADLVSFSGDKLLGGPQAGIIVGRRELIAKIRKHPLNRALRVDKLTVAALEATLELYRDGELSALPTHRMLTQSTATLQQRAQRLAALLAERGVRVTVIRTEGQVGGGAMPLARPVSYACVLASPDPDRAQELLRGASTPVITRILEGGVLLDVRCVEDGALAALADAVHGVSARLPC